jgi:hypothetical protein
MAGLQAPLSTLRLAPRDALRMTRGQSGLLFLHCWRLALFTLCRSPGAQAYDFFRFVRSPLVGLAMSFALPTFAQQTNRPDPKLRQQYVALVKKYDEAANKNDAAAVAALFTRTRFLLRTQDQSTVGKQLRNGMQTCSRKCI